MNKKEIAEIKKLFTPSHCAITRICGCYVDAEKNIKTKLKEAFLSLEEEEMFKYFKIFKSTLSGTIGKNLLNMEFPLSQESEGGTQEFLLKLRNSELKDEALIDEFYEKVMADYLYPENYYIILIHGAYDVPGRASDNLDMDDASTDVYQYVLCSICPVKLSKAALCYNARNNAIEERIRDWIVDVPDIGFLFPAFIDRTADIHNVLYYTKKPEEIHEEFIRYILGTGMPVTAGNQKEAFQTIITDTLGMDCDYEVIRNIHENLNEMIEEQKDSPEPLTLSRNSLKNLLETSGVSEEKLQTFDANFDRAAAASVNQRPVAEGSEETLPAPAPGKVQLYANNIASTKSFEVKTPEVVIKVNPDRADLVETREIDGRKCIVIEITDEVSVNGIPVKY